jgi:hypothetical protein
MKIDTGKLNPPVKFNFSEDEGSGAIYLRVMSPGKLAEVRDETFITKVEYKLNNRFEYQDIDYEKRDRIIWDYCIERWEGLVDDDDNPIECTIENKLMLMNDSPGFAAFVQTCLDKLNIDQEKRVEYLEKN